MKRIMSFLMGMSVGALAVTYSNKLKLKLNDLANQTIDKMKQWKDDFVEEDDDENVIDEYEYDSSSKMSKTNSKKASPKQKKSKLS